MKTIQKLLALSLAVLMLASCGGDTSWVYRSGDISVPPGLYTIYQVNGFSQAESKLAEEHAGDTSYTSPGIKDLLKSTVDGKSAPDYIGEKTREGLAEFVAIKQEFDRRGLTLSEAEQASVDSSVSQIKAQSGDFYVKNGVSDASIKEYYAGVARKNRLFLSLYGEGGESEVPAETLKAYLKDNYALVDVALVPKPLSVPEGETKSLEELQTDAKKKAEDYLARIKGGEAMEQIAYEVEVEYTAEADKANVKKPAEGELRMILSDASRASYGDAVVDAALGAQVGEPELVEESSMFLIIRRRDILEDPALFDAYRDSLLSEMKGEEYNEKVKALVAGVQLEANQAALNKYKPSRIKFDEKQQ